MDTIFNKSFVTNLLAAAVTLVGYYTNQFYILSIGMYALSGAVTNWLAVYMLFEKVPFLYGSGVVPLHFEDFKKGILRLIMEQFFTVENITRFFHDNVDQQKQKIDLKPILDAIEYETLYQSLVSAIMDSSLGGMVNMVGGPKLFDSVKESFIDKLKVFIGGLANDQKIQSMIDAQLDSFHPEKIVEKVAQIVTKRLDELTPNMVKEIIQAMIQKHLGWLVVWGGVFGALIGFVYALCGNHL